MPYEIDGELYARVTECIGAWQCPLPAWNDQHHPKKYDRPKRVHYSGVRGTSVHDSIQAYIVRTEGLPKPIKKPRPKEHYKIIWEDVCKPSHEQLLKYEIQRAWINFQKWWYKAKEFYKIRVLYCEKKVWSVTHKVAGTCDVIAIMEIHGKDYLVVIDWKSSTEWSITFKWQTSGYQGLTQEMQAQRKLELPRDIDWYDRTLTVILGGLAPQEVWSPFDFRGFLNCVRAYRNPQKIGKQTICVFCGDYYRCPFAKPYRATLEYIPEGADK